MKREEIVLLTRKKIPGVNSIEEIFNSLTEFMPNVVVKEVPTKNINIKNIITNLIYAKKERGNKTHITGDIHYLSLATGRKTVLTIHDIQSCLKGDFLQKLLIKLFWFYIPALLVSNITVVSNFTKMELLQVIPFAKDKIKVIYNPYNKLIKYNPKPFNEECPKILHIGTKENKNLIRVIQALKGLPCELIIVGKLNEKQYKTLNDNNILFSNFFNLSYNEIIELYYECDIVSFPSLYEGFGMPIIEGNKAGRPVITSKICSMPEIANDAAYLVEPYNIESIREGFVRIIKDENLRNQLIINGLENIKRFSPEKIANDYMTIYSKL